MSNKKALVIPLKTKENVQNLIKIQSNNKQEFVELLVSIKNRHMLNPVVTFDQLSQRLSSGVDKESVPLASVTEEVVIQEKSYLLIENYFTPPLTRERRRYAIAPRSVTEEDTIHEKYSFHMIFKNENLKKSFQNYLKESLSEGPLLFIEQVQAYKKDFSKDDAIEIMKEFILTGSFMEIEFPEVVVEEFYYRMNNFEELKKELFDELLTVILDRLENQLFARYKKSKEFKEYLFNHEGILYINGKFLVGKHLINSLGIKIEDLHNNQVSKEIETIFEKGIDEINENEQKRITKRVDNIRKTIIDHPQSYYFYPLKDHPKLDLTLEIEYTEKREIKLISLDKLIELVTSNIDSNDILYTLILTYKSFTTPYELLNKLIIRYFTLPDEKVENFNEWKTKILFPIQYKVIQILKFWIEKYQYEFDQELKNQFNEFIKMLKTTKGETNIKILERAFKTPLPYKPVVNPENCPAPLIPKKNEKELFEWPIKEIARQLTLFEFELFRKIQANECMNQNWTKQNRQTKAINLNEMIEWFNRFSSFMSFQILKRESANDRAKILSKIINIAAECRKLNNFNGTFELISCTTIRSIHRLKKTWGLLKKNDKQLYEELLEYISNKSNWKFLRNQYNTSVPPIIPYLGTYLSDLTFIEDANQDFINSKINFEKRTKISNLIKTLQIYQSSPYHLIIIEDISKFFSNIESVKEQDLNELSSKREKNSN